MDPMTHKDHGQMSHPHAGHKMSHDHRSHDRHAGHSVAMFRDRFWLSFALTLPTVFLSPEVQHWLGYTAPSFPGSTLIPAILGTAVFLYGGLVFLRGAQSELADRKPGTLTRGAPAVSGIAAVPGTSESELLALAAAVEANSEHPLARAIVGEATRQGVRQVHAANFEALAGRGARALVEGKNIAVGGPRLLAESKTAVPPELEKVMSSWASEGRTVLSVVTEGRLLGALAVEDEIRPESREAVTDLHRLGIRVAMITGDSKTVADSVARRLGIDEVAAEVLPGDKAAAVKRFQAGGKRVAMVGDGVNDAPALATADVGIAIGAGTDVAIESAGIVLVHSDPRDVVGAIELSHATYRKMIQNLVWATAYNLVAIPVAGGLFVRWGFDLPMSVGAVAMSASTIIVAVNAQLLRHLKLRRAVP